MDLNRRSTTLCTVKKHTETQFLFLFQNEGEKQKHNFFSFSKMREKKVQDGKTQVLANKETSQEVELQGERKQIKHPNPLLVRSILNNERQVSRTRKKTIKIKVIKKI
jgi:hypothetical protein